MKLIISEYLSSLRERNELDAILPDLLSQMGLTVYSKPGRGTRQDGVDVAAYGSLNGDDKKVYLFSIKAGNLTRSSWDGDELQSLRPSLNEIIDSYIPNRLPKQYQGEPIVICLCFGGYVQEQVRTQVEGYIQKNTTKSISFEEWNGDTLADLIQLNFLREDLFLAEDRSMLRKSLALLDEPDISYKHFSQLAKQLTTFKSKKNQDIVRGVRQLNISLWILFSWCREANNLEAVYLASELALLYSWDITKEYIGKTNKFAKQIMECCSSIQQLNFQISTLYIETKILPYTDNLYALSNAINPSCKVDVNLKIFDVLGRLSLTGLWLGWHLQQIPANNTELREQVTSSIYQYQHGLKQLIDNNPMLMTPYTDEQAIDIALAFGFLTTVSSNREFISSWLDEIISRTRFLYETHQFYPSNLHTYHELIVHPLEKNDSYRKEVTMGSILYPYIAMFSALLSIDDVYTEIQNFKSESLNHCNFQLWFPDETSEDVFYTNKTNHGAVLSDVAIDRPQDEFLDQIFNECDETKAFQSLTAIKQGIWPIALLASRHYRVPISPHFFKELRTPVHNPNPYIV